MKALIFAFVLLGACAHKPPQETTAATAPEPELETAVAIIKPSRDYKVTGSVTFTKTPTGVLVSADLSGLRKKSTHAFHIHENGDCSAVDFKSAGGHYNPTNKPHGDPLMNEHHAGDFGNLTVDRKGRVKFEKEFAGLTINGAVNPILKRSVIIHSKADDFKSQPAGDSGDRMGCGVIEAK